MKVMCVTDNFINRKYNKKAINCPKFGEIVTVLSLNEKGYYYLLEYPKDDYGNNAVFNSSKFIPLSNIDEKELIKERELVNA